MNLIIVLLSLNCNTYDPNYLTCMKNTFDCVGMVQERKIPTELKRQQTIEECLFDQRNLAKAEELLDQ